MKTIPLFVLMAVLFISCKKELRDDAILIPAGKTAVKLQDSIPDHGFFKIRLLQDSSSMDETVLYFNHAAQCEFNGSTDAEYFQGFGTGSLSSITSDNVACAIKTIPYIPGYAVRLKIHAKNNSYILKISALNKIPAGIRIWLKDNMLKDSLDLRKGNYSFNINQSDTSSFGSRRYKVILQ